jgi:hypothetical protein
LKLELLYSSRRDGCTLDAFHKRVDHIPGTLTVMTSFEKQIFGGYLSVSMDRGRKDGTRTRDEKAFLFSLTRNEIYPVRDPNRAWYEDEENLVGFGKDDLRVIEGCEGQTLHFGEDYKQPDSLEYEPYFDSQSNTYLHGQDTWAFDLREMEVFKVSSY